jgi:hypothetical protein
MADQMFCFMEGLVKDVPIQIDDHFIPTDFLVVDMGEDECDPPIILGRPFLSTTAIIYITIGEVHFQFPLEKVRRHFNNNYVINEESKKNRSRRRHRTRINKNQSAMDGCADYEEKVTRHEDLFPEGNTSIEEEAVPPTESDPDTKNQEEEKTEEQASPSKSTSPTKQVWRVKVKSVSDSTQEEDQTEASLKVPQKE